MIALLLMVFFSRLRDDQRLFRADLLFQQFSNPR
jgi:hypothetical protein